MANYRDMSREVRELSITLRKLNLRPCENGMIPRNTTHKEK